MNKTIIFEKMHELEKLINYKFKKISLLADAMKSPRLSLNDDRKKNSELNNDALAMLGDNTFKMIINDLLFDKDIEFKSSTSANRKKLESRSVMHAVIMNEGIINYAYDDNYFYIDEEVKKEKLKKNLYDFYLVAIVGAIYLDSNHEETKKWVKEWLVPKLIKYKNE